MRRPSVDDLVMLIHDIPELSLSRGDRGVVRSTWFAPTVAYEVEFLQIGNDYQAPRYQARALLLEDQVEVVDWPLVSGAVPGTAGSPTVTR